MRTTPDSEATSVATSLAAQAGLLVEMASAALQPRLENEGLSLASFDLLSAVKASNGGTQADIARRLGVSPGTLSEAVKAAVQRGLIEQISDGGDARLRRLRLTRSGSRVLNKILKSVDEIEVVMLDGIAADKIEVAREVLWRAIRNLAVSNNGQ